MERVSRLVITAPLPDGYDTASTTAAVIAALKRQPEHLVKTLTWDQGREVTHWHKIEAATGAKVYFCEPRSSWQRPSNEQANGLLRRWLPRAPTYPPHPYLSPSSKTTSTTCPANSTDGYQPNHLQSTMSQPPVEFAYVVPDDYVEGGMFAGLYNLALIEAGCAVVEGSMTPPFAGLYNLALIEAAV